MTLDEAVSQLRAMHVRSRTWEAWASKHGIDPSGWTREAEALELAILALAKKAIAAKGEARE